MVGEERDSRKYKIRGVCVCVVCKIRLRVFTEVNCRLGVVACLSADVTDGVPEAASGPKKNIAKKQLVGISACSARLRHFGCSEVIRRHANHSLKPSRNNPYSFLWHSGPRCSTQSNRLDQH